MPLFSGGLPQRKRQASFWQELLPRGQGASAPVLQQLPPVSSGVRKLAFCVSQFLPYCRQRLQQGVSFLLYPSDSPSYGFTFRPWPVVP
jgi:hypothetical protein